MGNRLSKIYTRTGDKGETGLGDGSRVSKSSLRIQAIGDTDELNSCLGLLVSHLDKDDELQPLLSQIQHDLFDIGGEMAMPGYELLKDNPVEELEAAIDQLVEIRARGGEGSRAEKLLLKAMSGGSTYDS